MFSALRPRVIKVKYRSCSSGGRLVIHKNGTVEQNGVSLSAPTFKFYQPKTGAENDLKISLTKGTLFSHGTRYDIDFTAEAST